MWCARQTGEVDNVILQPGVVGIISQVTLHIEGVGGEVEPAKYVAAIEAQVKELAVAGERHFGRVLSQIIGGFDSAHERVNHDEPVGEGGGASRDSGVELARGPVVNQVGRAEVKQLNGWRYDVECGA